MKSNFELFGPRIWYMTLRESSNIPKSVEIEKINDKNVKVEKPFTFPLIVNEDIPNAFRHSSVNGMK